MLKDASEWISEALARPILTSLQRCCRKNLNLPFAGPRKTAHGIKENGHCAQHVRRKASSQGSWDDLRIRRGISARCARERVSLGSRQEMPFEDNRSARCLTSRCAWSNQPYFMFILLLMVSCSGYSSGVAAHCEKGVKYFDKNSATCVPCSECKRPLYAIIPCYEFMDTVCDNPAEFLSERSGVIGTSNAGSAGGNHPNPPTDGNLPPNRTRPSSGRVSPEPGRRGRRKKNGRKKKRRKNGRKRKNKNGTEFEDRLSNSNSNSNTNSMHDDYNSGARGPVFGNYLDYDSSFYEYSDYLEYWDALRAEYEQNGHSPTSFSNQRNNPDSDAIYPQEISDERSITPRNMGDNGSAQNTATVGLNEINSSDVNEPIKENINSTTKSSTTNNSDDQNLDKMDANNDSSPQSEVSTVPRPRFEVGKLWRNGWTTAIVLALVIVVGLMAVALIIVLGMQVFIYSKNRIVDRMKDKNDYQDNGGGFSSAVLLHQSPPSPILATSDAHHLQHKLKGSDEKENSEVLMGGGSLPVARPKARKLGFTLGRGSKEKIFHVARTYKPAPCRSKFDSSQDLPPMHERLMTLAPNPALTQNSASIECSGTTYCSGEWLDHNCIPPGYEAGSKETTFTSLSSANNSPPLSPLSDGPAPQSFAPKPPARLTKSQEEKILRSSNTSSHSTPMVDCVLSSNVVTFDDGSTLSTTTNYTTNPRPSTGRALTNAPAHPYSQTLPTTYVRTSPRTLSSDQQNTGSPPSSSASAHGGADVSPSFPAILESKGSPIPYTMDRLLEQRRRLGCASSVDTNIYVEMWRGSSAAPSNNPSAVPSPALQHRTTTSTTSVPSSSSSTHRAGEEAAGDSFAALERNLATLSRGIESLHASTRGSSPSGTSGGSPSLRRGGGGGSSNNSSICSSRLAHRLTAHLNSVAAANTLQGSPKLTLRHFK